MLSAADRSPAGVDSHLLFLLRNRPGGLLQNPSVGGTRALGVAVPASRVSRAGVLGARGAGRGQDELRAAPGEPGFLLTGRHCSRWLLSELSFYRVEKK